MYYMDVDLYRYYIGRDDQSVNEKVMIGRIDQQIKQNIANLGLFIFNHTLRLASDPAPERLALAVAYGSAAAGLPGTTIPQPSQLRTELVGVTALTPSTGGTA